MEREQVRQKLTTASSFLSAEERIALLLYYNEECTIPECAAILDIDITTCQKLLSSAHYKTKCFIDILPPIEYAGT